MDLLCRSCLKHGKTGGIHQSTSGPVGREETQLLKFPAFGRYELRQIPTLYFSFEILQEGHVVMVLKSDPFDIGMGGPFRIEDKTSRSVIGNDDEIGVRSGPR